MFQISKLIGDVEDRTNYFWYDFHNPESLYFWSYAEWKLGFLTSPKTSIKHMLWKKSLYLEHTRSKLSNTYYIRKMMNHNICGGNFKITSKKLDTWQVVHFSLLKETKITSVGKIAISFFCHIKMKRQNRFLHKYLVQIMQILHEKKILYD